MKVLQVLSGGIRVQQNRSAPALLTGFRGSTLRSVTFWCFVFFHGNGSWKDSAGRVWRDLVPSSNDQSFMVFMKKFLFAVVAALAVLATSGCDDNTPWGVEYSLNSTGKTDASVTLMVFNGSVGINGDADYVLEWSNAPKALGTDRAVLLSDALQSSDAKTLRAAEYVNGWLDEWFKVTAFEGHYDIYIKGYVKETKTQIAFEIDRHFTNIEE